MKTLPIDDHNQGIFSHKLGHFFPIFEEGQGRPPNCHLCRRNKRREILIIRVMMVILLGIVMYVTATKVLKY